jgi:hypothetical protein
MCAEIAWLDSSTLEKSHFSGSLILQVAQQVGVMFLRFMVRIETDGMRIS